MNPPFALCQLSSAKVSRTMNLFKWISFILLIFLKEGSPCLTPESYGSFEWHNYSGFCYSSGDNIPYTWERSNTACSNSSSLLASLHSMNDLAFLQNMLSRSTDVFWIGLRAKGLYSSYEWADGTAVDFVNWTPGDSDDGTINSDTCVYLDPSTGYFGKQNCNETHFYLCKGKDNSTAISTATSSPTITYVLSALCPDGYDKFGDKCYGMFGLEIQGKKSWSNANRDCKEKGATMVSIHSKDEQDFVYRKMSDKTDMTWIGMYEFESTDDRAFHWSDGSPMDFTYWDIGQPNNWEGNKEECVNIRFERPHSGKWNDAGCNTVLQSYICQIHAVPNPLDFAQGDVCTRPEGWIRLGSSCYRVFNESESSVPWDQAQSLCNRFGGNLASVKSYRETTFLRFHLAGLQGYFWIGLRNEGRQKKFSWITGPADYSNWDGFQPFELSDKSNCVTTNLDGRWTVQKCDENHPFVCEVTEGTPAVAPEEPGIEKKCPNSSMKWTDYGGDFCYIIERTDEVTWYEASHRCFQEGGFMASFHSLQEVNLVLNQVKNNGKALHIGLAQTYSGDFGWVDRSVVDFVNWEPGQPNSNSQMCAEMFSNSGRWNDITCDSERGYICSVSKIISSDVPSKDKPQDKEGEKKLGVGGILAIILCVSIVVTIAVATYCYLHPSKLKFFRLTEPRVEYCDT